MDTLRGAAVLLALIRGIRGDTCSDKAAGWAALQLFGNGCAADGANQFFDLKKNDVDIAAPAGTPEITEACCTPFSDAKCSDWALIKGDCDSGQDFVPKNDAPADSTNGKDIALATYKSACCAAKPERKLEDGSKCSDKAAGWAALQLFGNGCAADGANQFFDLKKNEDDIAAPAGTPEIKEACCTPFSDAKCSDWALIKGDCDSGQDFVPKNDAPADSTNGKDIALATYKSACCAAKPEQKFELGMPKLSDQVATSAAKFTGLAFAILFVAGFVAINRKHRRTTLEDEAEELLVDSQA